jgi:hypothetical protein
MRPPSWHDRTLQDLVGDLETALTVIEAAECRSRNAVQRERFFNAAVSINCAIVYLHDLFDGSPTVNRISGSG